VGVVGLVGKTGVVEVESGVVAIGQEMDILETAVVAVEIVHWN
jgi:hypothetical protein